MAAIVNIDHETGDLSQYSGVLVDEGDMSASMNAAYAGSWGAQFVIDDTTVIYGYFELVEFPASNQLRWRFYIDPNNITIPVGDYIWICRTQGIRIYLQYDGSDYFLRIHRYDDAGYVGTDDVTITDDWVLIEVQLGRATSDVASDGTFNVWIEQNLESTDSALDNYDVLDISPFYVRLGAPGVSGSPSGIFYIDEIVARDDDTEIGPVPAGADPMSTTMRLVLGL